MMLTMEDPILTPFSHLARRPPRLAPQVRFQMIKMVRLSDYKYLPGSCLMDLPATDSAQYYIPILTRISDCS
jgi:hypothetical protein